MCVHVVLVARKQHESAHVRSAPESEFRRRYCCSSAICHRSSRYEFKKLRNLQLLFVKVISDSN